MSPETLDRMKRQIDPCKFTNTETEATWKLNQNKPDAVRLRVPGFDPDWSSDARSGEALLASPSS